MRSSATLCRSKLALFPGYRPLASCLYQQHSKSEQSVHTPLVSYVSFSIVSYPVQHFSSRHVIVSIILFRSKSTMSLFSLPSAGRKV